MKFVKKKREKIFIDIFFLYTAITIHTKYADVRISEQKPLKTTVFL